MYIIFEQKNNTSRRCDAVRCGVVVSITKISPLYTRKNMLSRILFILVRYVRTKSDYPQSYFLVETGPESHLGTHQKIFETDEGGD